jgi:GntR family transcriptional repressor for pyruvate dehydrogenase complex
VERELSETFKVSRATVREAIFSLESMRLVQRRQGDGTYVIASSEEALVQPLATALFHEKDDIIDIFFVRKIIEPEVAQLASENRTPEEIDELEKVLKQQEKEVESGKNPIHTDSEFHRLLARMGDVARVITWETPSCFRRTVTSIVASKFSPMATIATCFGSV